MCPEKLKTHITNIHPARINHEDLVFRSKEEMDKVIGAFETIKLRVVDNVLVFWNEWTKHVSRIN